MISYNIPFYNNTNDFIHTHTYTYIHNIYNPLDIKLNNITSKSKKIYGMGKCIVNLNKFTRFEGKQGFHKIYLDNDNNDNNVE